MDTLANKNCEKIAKDSDLLVSESTYLDEEKELAKEHFHLTASQAAEIAKKAKAKKLILTHLSQRYEDPRPILEEAKAIFKEVSVAQDLDYLEI